MVGGALGPGFVDNTHFSFRTYMYLSVYIYIFVSMYTPWPLYMDGTIADFMTPA